MNESPKEIDKISNEELKFRRADMMLEPSLVIAMTMQIIRSTGKLSRTLLILITKGLGLKMQLLHATDGGDEEPPPVVKTPTPKPVATPPPVPKIVSGGVVNGKAVNLVRPPYPPAAKAVRASGAVNVQVTIDENGNVISASRCQRSCFAYDQRQNQRLGHRNLVQRCSRDKKLKLQA